MDESELIELLSALCNDTLSDGQRRRLQERLLIDADARRLYSDYLDVHLAMVDHATSASPGQAGAASHNEPPPPPTKPMRPPPALAASPRRSAPLALLLGGACAALATAALVTFALRFELAPGALRGPAPQAVATAESPRAAAEPRKDQAGPLEGQAAEAAFFVARVTGISPDVVWNNNRDAGDFLLRLRRGDLVSIAAGYVQLDYYSGAKLHLVGPCEFVLTGESSGRLQRGKLKGNVSQGNFLLTTPTARVIDLGTEFGVAVGHDDRTDVCVFDGEVELVSEDGHRPGGRKLLLTKGEAAFVTRGGAVTQMRSAQLADDLRRQQPFDRPLLSGSGPVSLVDVLCVAEKASLEIASMIAPDTGLPDRQPWLRPDGPGYCLPAGYRTADWHPFVDGVFVPPSESQPTRIDSAGRRVELPPTTGRTWGPIWSRRRTAGAVPANVSDDYWGTATLAGVFARFASCEYGMVGIHSNVGITLDLKAIAAECGQAPTRVEGIVCNLDNSMKRLPEWAWNKRFAADVRIFVDGELRESVLDFARDDGDQRFTATLRKQDRYLTIVTTDAGIRDENGAPTTTYDDAYDHVVLIDPVLLFSE
ncbi:hypothetical protein [Botrimarina sp.]|uniref:hypothetical protein n=1 Tax=Botrimarina sp. TaxID=2795802 RepID=UPI0032ECA683